MSKRLLEVLTYEVLDHRKCSSRLKMVMTNDSSSHGTLIIT